MSFDKLVAKVQQAEDALEANERRLSADLRQFRHSWHALWTPGRILLAGLGTGLLTGFGRPAHHVAAGGSSLLRWLPVLSSLLASSSASDAAGEAAHAADSAEMAGVAAATTAAETLP